MNQDFFVSIAEICSNIPFNNILGIKLGTLDNDEISINFEMTENLIGNFIRGTLHGGVISSVLDVVGGLAALVGTLQEVHSKNPLETVQEKFSKLGTIDLRVDYLRPGIGKKFIATACILRVGKKVAVTEMKLYDENKKLLIAAGRGAYVVS